MMQKRILISFDIEEFDMPMEYGKKLSPEEQINTSARGTEIVLDILRMHKIKATFFSTVVFASRCRALIQRIINEGHELASHGWFHSEFKNEHLQESRLELSKLSGHPVKGFRMARMMPVEDAAIH